MFAKIFNQLSQKILQTQIINLPILEKMLFGEIRQSKNKKKITLLYIWYVEILSFKCAVSWKRRKWKKDGSWVKVNQQGMQAPKGWVQGWERDSWQQGEEDLIGKLGLNTMMM